MCESAGRGRSGGWRRNALKARHVKQGDLGGTRVDEAERELVAGTKPFQAIIDRFVKLRSDP